MCGRARLSSDVSEIKIAFGIPPDRPTPNIAPSWNLAPTDPVPVVYYDAKDGGRQGITSNSRIRGWKIRQIKAAMHRRYCLAPSVAQIRGKWRKSVWK
jgi:putative SOS response-associated peptidase YedK